MANPKQPNILFVMFDQMAALSLPAYGHKLVKTPHLDALGGAAAPCSRMPIARRRSARRRASAC